MNRRLALTLLAFLATPCLAVAAPAKKDVKKHDLPDCNGVQLDGSSLTPEENDFLFSIQKTVMTSETLGFAVGANTILSEYYAKRKTGEFNADVLKLKELAKKGSLNRLVIADFETAEGALGDALKDHKFSKDAYEIVSCRVAAIGDTSANGYNTYATLYLKGLQAKQEAMNGQVGYFDVTVNDCTISKSIDTGNRYTTVKPDPDARFLTVNATFKNTDNEGRLPLEGSLFISMDGKDYKFDTTESIMSEGYGIRMRSLNPLIKLNTKIVYKVPNELSGEVYWKPGRNAEDKRLWCTYLPSA
ncbi:hypothetical protein AO073_01660 [Pseudomonas syringae ICMP 11293]|uniref:DUF4352 domain-containing protein n=1 Tax=Pseudomonas syringae TaxID=317 RepID=UPI000731976E|nr:DUF4352 domain-containing protein [Pseudomonas syringae]KTB91606.1 hypothetical protein AO073_01660 [Pseudomonas syringae ICMP 11293]